MALLINKIPTPKLPRTYIIAAPEIIIVKRNPLFKTDYKAKFRP
jgi:hypothetical protein